MWAPVRYLCRLRAWNVIYLLTETNTQTLLILRAEKSQFSLLPSTAVRWFRVLLCRSRRANQVVSGQGGGRCISTGQSLKYNFWRASCGLAESTAAKAEHFPWICGPRALPLPVLFARTGDKGLWAECSELRAESVGCPGVPSLGWQGWGQQSAL